MRRKTPGVLNKEDLLSERIARLEQHDPATVVRTLEPFILDRRKERLKEVIGKRLASIAVLFEAPHDPHNGAAVLRSCEAFGVQSLHVVEKTETFLAASSVARGAEKWIDVVAHRSVPSALAATRGAGLPLVAARADGALLPEDLARLPRFTLVLGNERDGISRALEGACDHAVRVPMRGFIESLNVSVTAAILLSAATRDRPGDLDERTRLRLYARGLYLSTPRADELLSHARISV